MTKEELLKEAKKLKNSKDIENLVKSSGLEISDEELDSVSGGCAPDDYGYQTPQYKIGDKVWWRDDYNGANKHFGYITYVEQTKRVYETTWYCYNQLCFHYNIKEEKNIYGPDFTGKEFKGIPECNIVMDS